MKFKAGDRIEPTYRKSMRYQSLLHSDNHGLIVGASAIMNRTVLQKKHSTDMTYTVLWDCNDVGQIHSIRYIEGWFKQCRKQSRERRLKLLIDEV